MIPPALSREARFVVIAGAGLFFAGLVQGMGLQAFANPRMALSAHLEAVQSGVAMMVAGVLWRACTWSVLLERIARWALVAGMIGLWLGITLAAMTGASEALPMAGAGFSASAGVELAVGGAILCSSAALAIGWALFLWGLIRG